MKKSRENCYFDHICHPEQNWEKSGIWRNLLPWAKQWKPTILIIFATLSKSTGKVIFDNFATMRKNMENYYFDHICHLGKVEDKVVFGQICYTGQNINKMIFCSDLLSLAKILNNEFWSHLLQWVNMGNYSFDRICYREQTHSKIRLRSVLPIWAKAWQISVSTSSLLPL